MAVVESDCKCPYQNRLQSTSWLFAASGHNILAILSTLCDVTQLEIFIFIAVFSKASSTMNKILSVYWYIENY